jgi:hypothetical protein
MKVKNIKVNISEKVCPKCKKLMERRTRIGRPKNKTYYYTEWDYCKPCGHVQHYDEYKSAKWQEDDNRAEFCKHI